MSFNDDSMAIPTPSVQDSSQPWCPEALNTSWFGTVCISCLESSCQCGYVTSANIFRSHDSSTAGNWDLSPLVYQSGQQLWLNAGVEGPHHGGSRGYTRLTATNPQPAMNDTKQYYALGNTSRMVFASDATFSTTDAFSRGQPLPEAAYGATLASGPLDTSRPDTFQTLYELGDQMATLSPDVWPTYSNVLRGEEFGDFGLPSIPPSSNASAQVMTMEKLNSGPLLRGNSVETPDFVIPQSAMSPWEFSSTGSQLSPPDSSVYSTHISQRTRPNRNTPTTSSRSSRRPASCHYPTCDRVYFQNTRELKLHLNRHMAELLQHWVAGIPSSCHWPTCTSNLMFNSRKLYQTHLENIHVKPLLCTERGCKHKTPFRNNYDLERHIRTIHTSEKEWNCPYLDCPTEPLPRKDKWLKHLRQHLATDFTCPLPHCSTETAQSFQSQGQVVVHIQESHGKYECALGSCLNGRRSRFSESGLLQHLELEHSLMDEVCITACNSMKSLKERTICLQHLAASAEWQDCSLCA